jgi:transcription elongation GreA/GreB family factor
MSRAFVKESEDSSSDADLPERPVSPHRNLVTASGLEQIGSRVKQLEEELTAARAAGDKALIARCQRDLRYWNQRRGSAELVPRARPDGRARFGSAVTVEFADGSRRELRIVGEDEADPAAGTVAYVAPVAAAMIGAQLGERVSIGGTEGEIVGIA